MARITEETKSSMKGLSHMKCQIKYQTPNQMFLLRQPCLFSIDKNPHQAYDMAKISAAKHQSSDKYLKIKYKALGELEKGTPHKDVALLFDVPKKTLSPWKKKQRKYFPIVWKWPCV